MNILLNFLFLSLIYLNFSSAQWQRCHGKVWMASCLGGSNRGQQGPICQGRLMWYYDSELKSCRPMQYRGCGGNSNRWCSRKECDEKCQGVK